MLRALLLKHAGRQVARGSFSLFLSYVDGNRLVLLLLELFLPFFFIRRLFLLRDRLVVDAKLLEELGVNRNLRGDLSVLRS